MSIVGYISCKDKQDYEDQKKAIEEFCGKEGKNLATCLVNRDWIHLREMVREGLVRILVVAHSNHLPFMYGDERDRLFHAFREKGAKLVSIQEGEMTS